MTMKFRAHDTFFIRKGWLSKGMERVVAKEDLFVDKNENPMDVLGIQRTELMQQSVAMVPSGSVREGSS